MAAIFLALALARAGTCVGCDISQADTFALQAQLQGLYEEMAEGAIHSTADDVAAPLTAELYAPDWVFIDASGQRQSLAQAQSATASALRSSPFDTITHSIQKVTASGYQVTVIVKVAVTMAGPDVNRQTAMLGRTTGWQLLPDLKLPRVETTTFRDTWVKAGNSWRMKSREQVGKPDAHTASANIY
jgi:hypothetical protein